MIWVGIIIGLLIGFIWGAWMMFKQMSDEKPTHTFKVSEEELNDIIEITKLGREIKKELEQ